MQADKDSRQKRMCTHSRGIDENWKQVYRTLMKSKLFLHIYNDKKTEVRCPEKNIVM